MAYRRKNSVTRSATFIEDSRSFRYDPDENSPSSLAAKAMRSSSYAYCQGKALDADNLHWLVEILVDRRIADDFAGIWANQNEFAGLHSKIPIVSRHLVSGVSPRIFVGIGRGEILPLKDTRQLMLRVWLQPLIDDYSWLQHCCRSFDRKVIEEGIGQTILTLPLEDQHNILLSWLGSFLKVGDNCPNLQRAFEGLVEEDFHQALC